MNASSTESSQGFCNEINLIMNFKTQKSFSLFRICMMLLYNCPEAIVIRDNPISCGILVKYKVSTPPPLNYGCSLDPQSFVRSAFQMFQRLLFVSRFMCSAGAVFQVILLKCQGESTKDIAHSHPAVQISPEPFVCVLSHHLCWTVDVSETLRSECFRPF